MSVADYIAEHGLTCAACSVDISSGGVGPGDGRLYCHPCWRSGDRAPEQLSLEGLA